LATPTDQPPFGDPPQGQPASQAASTPTRAGYTTQALAERHEALWLSLTTLHKDIIALGAKKPGAPVSEPVRIAAEGLLSDCAAFTRKRNERLPVAAGDLAGLAVQLGQALAGLEAWESRHTSWDARWNCRVWQVAGAALPVMRLKPKAAPSDPIDAIDIIETRKKLGRLIAGKAERAYEAGFRAGRAAEQAEAAAPMTQTYPRIARLD
jgi:hypothetical protein